MKLNRISWKESQTFYTKRLLILTVLAELVHQTTASTITRPKFDLAHGGHYKPLQNSPIYYLNLVKHVVLTTSRPFGMKGTGNSQPYRRKNSNLYKLPLKFVSNAKPIDIIHGMNQINKNLGKPYRKPGKYYKPSKMFQLSTKFLSNGKPVKPYLLKMKKYKY